MQSGEEQRSHTRGDMHVARCKCGSSSPLPAPSTQQTECPLLGPERSQAGAQHGEQRNGPVPTEQSGDGLGSFYPAGDARSHQARASCRPRRGRGGAQGRCPVAVSPEWRAERWLGRTSLRGKGTAGRAGGPGRAEAGVRRGRAGVPFPDVGFHLRRPLFPPSSSVLLPPSFPRRGGGSRGRHSLQDSPAALVRSASPSVSRAVTFIAALCAYFCHKSSSSTRAHACVCVHVRVPCCNSRLL